ncbi:hypothetical protein AB0E62_35425 [Streptomyces sp. NPDC038707]|uniref:hypothetical protein n=1 Tax=Streptomyces sp. NPDC038707 TaxID=3154329 RepID=UPI003404AD68
MPHQPPPRSPDHPEPGDLYRRARRDAEPFLAGHPLPGQPVALPDLTPYLQALPDARTPAEVSVLTHQLVAATAPVLDHIAGHFVTLALWAGTEHRHTPQSVRLLRQAAQTIRTALVKVAQADLENLRAHYTPPAAGTEHPGAPSATATAARAPSAGPRR